MAHWTRFVFSFERLPARLAQTMSLFTLEYRGILDGFQAHWALKRFGHPGRQRNLSLLSSRRHGVESNVFNLTDSWRLPANLKDTNINFNVGMKVRNGNLAKRFSLKLSIPNHQGMFKHGSDVISITSS